MISLPMRQVAQFRVRRQMLTSSTKGSGRSGILAALGTVQPAPDGLRWLIARVHDPDQQRWKQVAEEGEIVKARFFRGNLGWVLHDDLTLHLDACMEKCQPPLGKTAESIQAALSVDESMQTDLLQTTVRTSRANLRKALAELGRNQLIVEGPCDTWRLTSSLISRPRKEESRCIEARGELITRFLANYGPAKLCELADWSGWSPRAVQAAIDPLLASGIAVICQFDNEPQTHFIRQADIEEIAHTCTQEHSLAFLACYDPVVRAQQTELGQRFGYGCSIPAFWHYLLIDGEWQGALRIHYKMKMLWIRDLLLESPVLADPSLLEEVLNAIRNELAFGLNAIRIDWVNGTLADSPMYQALLSDYGYVAQDGACVLDLASPIERGDR